MRKITPEELSEILDKHRLWLNGDADLSGADLCGADLCGADLSDADLRRADLRRADLSDADLSGADLSGADLSGADLCGADLSGADLRRADLSDADLSGADLSGADLKHCIADEKGLTGRTLRGLRWRVYISPDLKTLTIGCQSHPVDNWAGWSSDSYVIKRMHSDAPGFWSTHKDMILGLCK